MERTEVGCGAAIGRIVPYLRVTTERSVFRRNLTLLVGALMPLNAKGRATSDEIAVRLLFCKPTTFELQQLTRHLQALRSAFEATEAFRSAPPLFRLLLNQSRAFLNDTLRPETARVLRGWGSLLRHPHTNRPLLLGYAMPGRPFLHEVLLYSLCGSCTRRSMLGWRHGWRFDARSMVGSWNASTPRKGRRFPSPLLGRHYRRRW